MVAVFVARASPTTEPCSPIRRELRRPSCDSDRRGETASAAADTVKAGAQLRPKYAAAVRLPRGGRPRTGRGPIARRAPTRFGHPLTGKDLDETPAASQWKPQKRCVEATARTLPGHSGGRDSATHEGKLPEPCPRPQTDHRAGGTPNPRSSFDNAGSVRRTPPDFQPLPSGRVRHHSSSSSAPHRVVDSHGQNAARNLAVSFRPGTCP